MDIDLPNLGNFTALDAVYDSASQQILFTDNGIAQSYSLTSHRVETHIPILQENPSPPTNEILALTNTRNDTKLKSPNNKCHFKFRPFHPNIDLHISASGLLVTCIRGNAEHLVISDVGFQSGVHFWEIICPRSLEGLSIGVQREEQLSPAKECFEGHAFRAKTSHTVGVRLDLDKGELNFWLDGIFQSSKTRKIKKGTTYFAAVKIQGMKSLFIVNPFATDPEEPLITLYENKPKPSISYVKEALQNWVILSGFSSTQKTNLQSKVFHYLVDLPSFAPFEYIFEDKSAILGLRFKSLEEAVRFIEKNNSVTFDGMSIFLLDQNYLQQWAIETFKGVEPEEKIKNTAQINSMRKWFKRNLNLLIKHGAPVAAKELSTQAELTKIITQNLLSRRIQERKDPVVEESKSASSSNTQMRLEYNSSSKNMLIVKDNMIKLVTRSADLREYPLQNAIFANRPNCPRDNVLIPMSMETLTNLFSNLDLENKLTDPSFRPFELKSIADFLKAIEVAISQSIKSADILYVRAQYKTFKRVIDLFLSDLAMALNKNNCEIQSAIMLVETKALLPVKKPALSDGLLNFDAPKETTSDSKEKTHHQEGPKSFFKQLTPSSLHNLMNSLLAMDEALFVMIQHEDASPKFQSYWQNRSTRLFSAFSRLSSLLNFPSNKFSLIELAESGIYNSSGALYDARHYLDPEKRLDAIQNLQTDQSLSSFLEKSLPDNRMVQGLPTTNVPLSVSVNNLPVQFHSRRGDDIDSTRILKLAQHPDSTHVVTISKNGDMKIWNTEVGLVNIGADNFRADMPPVDISVPIKTITASNSFNLGHSTSTDVGSGGFQSSFGGGFQPSFGGGFQPKFGGTFQPKFGGQFGFAGTQSGFGSAQFIEPDPYFYETLVGMGFPGPLASNVLIKTKNEGLQQALDMIISLQNTPNSPGYDPLMLSQAPKLKMKDEWTCVACTFINKSENKLCEICEQPPSLEAYVVEDNTFGSKQPELTDESEENKRQESLPAKEPFEKEITKLCTANAEITDVVLINTRGNKLCPSLVGVVFSTGKTSLLRLRHYFYTKEHVKKYLYSDWTGEMHSEFSNRWFRHSQGKDSIKEIQNHLLHEYRLSFTALDPLFENKKEANPKLASAENYLKAMKELDLPLPYESILSVATSQSIVEDDQEKIDLFVLGRTKAGLEIAHYLFTILHIGYPLENYDQNYISCKLIRKHEAKFVTGNRAELIVNETKDLLILDVDSSSLHTLWTGSITEVTSIQLSYKIKSFRNIDQKALLIIDVDNRIHVLELKSGYFKASSLNSQIQVPEKIGKELILPQVKKLTNSEIDSLHRTLYSRLQPGVLKTSGVLSSNFDRTTSSFSKFYLPLENNAKKVLEYELITDSELLAVNLILHFERGSLGETQAQKKEYYESLLNETAALQSKTPEELPSSRDAKEKQHSLPSITQAGLNLGNGEIGGGKYLPLTIVTFKGGSFSDKYPVTKMLSPNSDVFLSNQSGAEFVFQHLHGKTMIVQTVTVHSNFFSSTYSGYPIGSGLIFTSNYLAHFDMTSPFNTMSEQEYQKWRQERAKTNKVLEPWEPVGSFQFNEESEVVTIDLHYKRPAKYIFLKPTSMRFKPDSYSKFFTTSPLEIKFFGVTGSVQENDFSVLNTEGNTLQTGLSLQCASKCNLTVEVNRGTPLNPQWTEIYNNQGRSLNVNKVLSSKISRSFVENKQFLNLAAMSGSSSLEIASELFSEFQICSIRVTATVENSSEADEWKVTGLCAFATTSESITTPTTSSNAQDEKKVVSRVSLRTLQKDLGSLEKISQHLLEQLTDENCSLERRRKFSKLLSDLIAQCPTLAENVYKQLDLCAYLALNVLNETSSSISEVLSLLEQFLRITSFANDLLSALMKMLPHLQETSQITENGLDAFFNMILWCYKTDSERVFLSVLDEIEKTIKYIKQLRAPEYNLLRTQYGISSLVLEKELFSDSNISKNPHNEKDHRKNYSPHKSKARKPLPSRIVKWSTPNNEEYLIDLLSVTQISEVKIFLDKFTDAVTDFRVHIWAINVQKDKFDKTLIYSQCYKSSTWTQLTKDAYDSGNTAYFSDAEELKALGFSNLNVTTRYLVLQFNYTAFSSLKVQLLEKDAKNIIPEVYGESLEESKGKNLSLKEVQLLFDSAACTSSEMITLHGSNYEKKQVTNNCQILDSTGSLKRNSLKIDPGFYGMHEITGYGSQSAETHFSQLVNLQAELVGLLNTSRNSQSFIENKEKVINLCEMIENLQLTLLNMRNHGASTKIEPAKSLDFFYTLAIKYSQLLRKIDTEVPEIDRTWRLKESLKKENGVEIMFKIFETTMIFENSNISKEFAAFFSQVLIPTLEPRYSTELAFRIVDGFLTLPISITLSPAESIFSHMRVIEALNVFLICTGELLSYLTIKLGIPVNESANGQQISKDFREQEILTILATLFLLLKKQLNQTKSQSKNASTSEMTCQETKQSIKLKDSTIEISHFSSGDSLKAAFHTCVWICENNQLNKLDKVNLLSLGIDILQHLLLVSKCNSIKELLMASKSFSKLAMNIIQESSPILRDKFRAILDVFLNVKPLIESNLPKSDSASILVNSVDERCAEEIKLLLIQHFQQILHSLIDFALKRESPKDSGLTTTMMNYISPSNWLEYICFVAEFLTGASETTSKQEESKSDKSKPQPQQKKKVGNNIEEEIPMSMEDKKRNEESSASKNNTGISLETVNSLILLFSPETESREGFKLSQSSEAWNLIMKVVRKVESTYFVEDEVFGLLIKSFLQAPEEIQQSLIPEMLALTKNVLTHSKNQGEASSYILDIVLSIITKNEEQNLDRPMYYQLIKGWLDILLTMQTPKTADYYIHASSQTAACTLNEKGIQSLLIKLPLYLVEHLNIGGHNGANNCSEINVVRLQIANDLLLLLLTSENASSSLSITELFSNFKKFQDQIQRCIHHLIEWLVINRTTEPGTSPATDLMKYLSDNVLRVLTLAANYEEVSKTGISSLIQICGEVDRTIMKLHSRQQLSSHIALGCMERACNVLEELFPLWVTSDSIASHVAFEINGFEYLFDRAGVSSSSSLSSDRKGVKTPNSESSKKSLLEGMDLFGHINQTQKFSRLKAETKSPESTMIVSLDKDDDLDSRLPREEEFASNFLLVNEAGKVLSGAPEDWSLHKKGSRARTRVVTMQGPTYNEYYWIFNLGKLVELKQITIGFNSAEHDFADMILGIPSSVLIEGGTSLNDLVPLGVLSPINDEGYNDFAVKCLHKNFQTIRRMGGNVEETITSLSTRRISYLKIRIRRPVITFIENTSWLASKKYDNVAISVSFISILGYDTTRLPDIRQKLLKTQENSALRVLGELCNTKFSQTLATLANKDTLVSKIKLSYDSLASLLVPNEHWLTPVFLAIAIHNDEMGDWMMRKLLDTSRSREHAKVVGEIIACNINLLDSRLNLMSAFILEELKKYISANTTDCLNKFNSLVNFIEIFCSSIRYLPEGFVQQLNEGKRKSPTLFFGKENIDDIIAAFELFNASAFNEVLIRLLLLYVYAPKPFITTETTPGEFIHYTLENLWTRCESKPLYYKMTGPVIIGSKGAVKWFVPHLEKFLEGIVSSIQAGNSTMLSEIHQSLLLVHSLSYSKEIKKIIADKKWHLLFYNSLKTNDSTSNSILKSLEPDILIRSVEVLKNLVLGFETSEAEMAAILKEDLHHLESMRDMNYINNLLIPLLNAENTLPVCLHPYNSKTKQWSTRDKKLSNTRSHASERRVLLKSNILKKHHTEEFLKKLKEFTKQTDLSKKLSQLEWQLCFTAQADRENNMDKIAQQMSQKGPFLVLAEGMNQTKNKPCIVGLFSSQSIPELPSPNPQNEFSQDQSFAIPNASDSFLFYYEEDLTLHFAVPQIHNSKLKGLGQVHYFYDGGGGISFYYNGVERIFFSHTPNQDSFAEINFTQMKPIEALPHSPPLTFEFKSAEYWILKSKAPQVQALASKKTMETGALYPSWYISNHPLDFYRVNPVYSVPTSLNVNKLTKIMLGSETNMKFKPTQEQLSPNTSILDLYTFAENDPSSNNIIDLEYDVVDWISQQSQKDQSLEGTEKVSQQDAELKYMPAMAIFTAFEKDHGVEHLIDVTLKSLAHWKDKEKSKRWLAWIQELASFSQLPNYFGVFLKNRQCIDLLFQILAGLPDDSANSATTNWEEEEQKAVKFSYQILAEVFRVDSNVKIREIAIEKQFLVRVLERIETVSKEFKRKWTDKIEEEEASPTVSPATKGSGEEEDGRKKIKKKKGVGYASDSLGQNQVWDAKDYVEKKKLKNDQLINLLEIIRNFLDTRDWTPPKEVLNALCGSALLPLLESAFRSGSLLDMGKESELYSSYLSIHIFSIEILYILFLFFLSRTHKDHQSA